MHLIAHRGNISGPDPIMENKPEYIEHALKSGYDVEIDVWFVHNKLYLGHDLPQYEVTIEYLKNDRFWCHCKNIDALWYLLSNDIHCFFHNEDDATLTSRGIIWTFPNKKLMPNSICVMPELGHDGDLSKCLGVCSDYMEEYKK
tara:strand:- start:362 stop:793 length:432 start_codon:yes stop_codon:yes gene_type:complete